MVLFLLCVVFEHKVDRLMHAIEPGVQITQESREVFLRLAPKQVDGTPRLPHRMNVAANVSRLFPVFHYKLSRKRMSFLAKMKQKGIAFGEAGGNYEEFAAECDSWFDTACTPQQLRLIDSQRLYVAYRRYGDSILDLPDAQELIKKLTNN
jgi:hypothetical protein